MQQGGAQLAAPQLRQQPAAISPSAPVNSRGSTRAVWDKAALDVSADDFTVIDDDTGVDDGFGRNFSFELEDFQSELDAAVRTMSLCTARCWEHASKHVLTPWTAPETLFPPRS